VQGYEAIPTVPVLFVGAQAIEEVQSRVEPFFFSHQLSEFV